MFTSVYICFYMYTSLKYQGGTLPLAAYADMYAHTNTFGNIYIYIYIYIYLFSPDLVSHLFICYFSFYSACISYVLSGPRVLQTSALSTAGYVLPVGLR